MEKRESLKSMKYTIWSREPVGEPGHEKFCELGKIEQRVHTMTSSSSSVAMALPQQLSSSVRTKDVTASVAHNFEDPLHDGTVFLRTQYS